MAPKAVAKGRVAPKAKGKAAPKAQGKAKAKAAPAPKAGAKRPAPAPPASEPAAKRAAAEAKAGAKAAARPVPKAAAGGAGAKVVDSHCPKQGLSVIEDYSAKLNQTNVGANNNKFYIIQALEGGGQFFAWNRWGRVGDVGQNKLLPCGSKEQAIKEFESKFKSKSCNAWGARANFKAVPGKYTLIETEEASGGQDQAPMGKLTADQINKGQAVLDKLNTALTKRKESEITDLSSQFFSLIPTNFGWKKPVPISTMNMLQEKQELLKFFLRMGFEQVEANKNLTPIDGVLDLPLPKSLDEAAAGTCGKGDVAASNKKGAELAAKQAGKPAKKMDASLYAAIMLYTSNAIYRDLNKALRDQDRGKIKKYFKYLRLLLEAMSALPQRAVTLWRGLSIDLADNPEYSVGKTVTWWGVSSCTSEQKVAHSFAKSCGGGASVVTVKAKTSCDISVISFFSNEKESLLRPGTMLKVLKREKKAGITEVTLEEVGSAIK